MQTRTSHFVISLDFELLWGVRDHATKESYGRNILGGRQAIPRVLDLFAQNGVQATWATVGMVLLESKDELLTLSPQLRPTYLNRKLSSYEYFNEVGSDERKDPYYFGASLARLISQCPGQEIGSHTFSHYYCLEEGQTVQQFEADCRAAAQAASLRQFELKSFVFPRNQFAPSHLRALAEVGMRTVRGNEGSWMYDIRTKDKFLPLKKAMRLIDSYISLSGANGVTPQLESAELVNVAASRFLRPYSPRLSGLENFRLSRVLNSMTAAARAGKTYHVWWHPHNFGSSTAENLEILAKVISHFTVLRDEFGMRSTNMGAFSAH